MRIPLINNKLVESVIRRESLGNPRAVSKKGAAGLMQIMPRTWAEWCWRLGLGRPSPYDPIANRKVGTAYLNWLLKQFNHELELSLAAYNWGIGNIIKLQKSKGPRFEDIEPYLPEETRQYVKIIKEHYLA